MADKDFQAPTDCWKYETSVDYMLAKVMEPCLPVLVPPVYGEPTDTNPTITPNPYPPVKDEPGSPGPGPGTVQVPGNGTTDPGNGNGNTQTNPGIIDWIKSNPGISLVAGAGLFYFLFAKK